MTKAGHDAPGHECCGVVVEGGVMAGDWPINNQRGSTIGHYKGRTISEWMEWNGIRYRYVGIAHEDADGGVELAQLAADEVVTFPGLIYRMAINA